MKGLRIVLIPLISVAAAFAGVEPDFSRPTFSFIPTPAGILAAHNIIRGKVGVPPLVWSDQLALVALQWANKLLTMGAFQHSGDPRYGENLFQISGPGARSNPYEVVNAWSAESGFYRYRDNKCTGICGHYTQVIWHDTRAVGCAVARDPQREIWVCNYDPFGNIVGERPY